MRDAHTEAETQAEREAGSMQGAQCGTQSWDPRIKLWSEGRHSTAEPPRHHSIFYTQRHRNIGKGRSRLHAGSPMWDLIPGLQDHDLSPRQMLNR